MISCVGLQVLQLVVAVNDRVTCCLKLNVIRVDAEVITTLGCSRVDISAAQNPSHADEQMLTIRCLTTRRHDYFDPEYHATFHIVELGPLTKFTGNPSNAPRVGSPHQAGVIVRRLQQLHHEDHYLPAVRNSILVQHAMSREVQVKKGSDIQAPDGPQTDGMIRMPAIVDMSDQICGTGRTDIVH
jgi:hypothetical protein